MKPSASDRGSRLKYLRKLTMKKYRRSEGRFLAEGLRLVKEALSSTWPVELLIVTAGAKGKGELEGILRSADARRIEVLELPEGRFDEISQTESSQGVLALIRERHLSLEEFLAGLSERALVVALDGVSDPGNVGTILRISDWFGADGVLLGDRAVELYNPKVIRASMGAIFHLGALEGVDLGSVVSKVRPMGFRIAVTAIRDGGSLEGIRQTGRTLLVLGSEARGVSEPIIKEADVILTIPGFGRAESLNVASSLAVVLAVWRGL